MNLSVINNLLQLNNIALHSISGCEILRKNISSVRLRFKSFQLDMSSSSLVSVIVCREGL